MSKKTVRKKSTTSTKTATTGTVKNTSANVKNKKRKASVKTTAVGTATKAASKTTTKTAVATPVKKSVKKATSTKTTTKTPVKSTSTKTTRSRSTEITCKTIAADQGTPLRTVQRHMSFFNDRPYVAATTAGSKVTYTKSSVKTINKIFNLISKGLTRDQVDAVLTAEYMKNRGVDIIAVADRAISRVTGTSAPTATIGQTASTDDEVVNTYW